MVVGWFCNGYVAFGQKVGIRAWAVVAEGAMRVDLTRSAHTVVCISAALWQNVHEGR